jgi:sec-independent protein translocase protein TatA
MLPFNVGPTELIILLVIVLIIFGPGKLPGIGGAIGKSIREFRKAQTGQDEEAAKPAQSSPEAPKEATRS